MQTQLFLLVNDFQLQRLPAFVVDFRCCLCDRVDFCPAVFYTVCAARLSHLKGVVVNLAYLTCHRLLKFVYKNRQFVPIYSKVIPQ